MCQSSASVLLGKAVAFEILRMTQGAARKRHICKAHQEPPVLAVSRVGTGRRWSEETAPPWSSIAQVAAQHAPYIFQTFSLGNAHIVWAAKHSFATNLLDPDLARAYHARNNCAGKNPMQFLEAKNAAFWKSHFWQPRPRCLSDLAQARHVQFGFPALAMWVGRATIRFSGKISPQTSGRRIVCTTEMMKNCGLKRSVLTHVELRLRPGCKLALESNCRRLPPIKVLILINCFACVVAMLRIRPLVSFCSYCHGSWGWGVQHVVCGIHAKPGNIIFAGQEFYWKYLGQYMVAHHMQNWHVATLPAYRGVQQRLLSWHPLRPRRVGRPRHLWESKYQAVHDICGSQNIKRS